MKVGGKHLPVGSEAARMPKVEALVFENLITMNELLSMLKQQYSVYTIYKWVQRYAMPHKRIRGKLWFPKAEVIQWLERGS